MENVEFDEFGNLSPYEVINIDLQTFQNNFVGNMKNSEYRQKLFDEYIKYTNDLVKIVSNSFYQWINGSYVTQKHRPKDIDLVSFIDYRFIKGNEEALKNFSYPLSKEIYKVDAYIVKTYPDNNKNHIISKSDTLYWLHLFQKTKPNKKGVKQYKGFIKIDLSHENI